MGNFSEKEFEDAIKKSGFDLIKGYFGEQINCSIAEARDRGLLYLFIGQSINSRIRVGMIEGVNTNLQMVSSCVDRASLLLLLSNCIVSIHDHDAKECSEFLNDLSYLVALNTTNKDDLEGDGFLD